MFLPDFQARNDASPGHQEFFDTPRLQELLTYLMEQHDLSRADLVPLLGTASRVSTSWAATP